MARLPTDDEMARIVLDIFKQNNCRPDHALGVREFVAYVNRSGGRYTMAEIGAGIDYGYSKGWLEDGPNHAIKLTQAGFDEM